MPAYDPDTENGRPPTEQFLAELREILTQLTPRQRSYLGIFCISPNRPTVSLGVTCMVVYTYGCDDGSRTRWLRIMFRGFSRSVWEVSIIRSSALAACFQPLVQSS